MSSGDEPAVPPTPILLVDNDPANLLALHALLDDLGYRLVDAHSGEEALRRLQEHDFALVLLNVRMPGMDGFETAQLIRSQERSRQTPIMFLTGSDDPSLSAERAYSLGAVDYLEKPLVTKILRAKVEGFVELFRKTEQVKHQAAELRAWERREFERQQAAESARRQRAEEALRDTEAKYRLIVETANEGIWQLDAGACITFVNQRMADMLGYDRVALLGKTLWDFIFVEDEPQVKQRLQQRRAGMSEQADVRFRRQDGQEVWMLMAGRPVIDSCGLFQGVIDLFTDVTERKRAEEALKEAAHRKDEFLATLAHELRNPLAPIRNALSLLRLAGHKPDILEHTRTLMERQVQQLVHLIDDLLEVSRVTHGTIRLRKEALDLATVIARAVEMARPLLDEHRHHLTTDIEHDPPRVEGDLTRLVQVVANLLNNAAKYTPPGGQIFLTVRREAPHAVIRVRDNGIGILPDLLPHVFELFAQGPRGLARAEGGLGIGLTLVKSLVEKHGGSVHASSQGAGQGAEFEVRLPLLGRDTRQQAAAGEADAKTCPRSFLVVDDNRDAADSLAMLLRTLGQRVAVAYDGSTAVTAAQTLRPDIVLLDIGLPDMDGYRVARALRSNPDTARTKIIAVTGYGQDEYRQKSREAGLDGHLVKPVDLAPLKDLLTP
jgi:PAS domain S-box-containing protein